MAGAGAGAAVSAGVSPSCTPSPQRPASARPAHRRPQPSGKCSPSGLRSGLRMRFAVAWASTCAAGGRAVRERRGWCRYRALRLHRPPTSPLLPPLPRGSTTPPEMSGAREKKRAKKMRNQPASVTLPAEPGPLAGGGSRACPPPGTAVGAPPGPGRVPPAQSQVSPSPQPAACSPCEYPGFRPLPWTPLVLVLP